MSDLRTAALRALEALEYYRSGEDYQPTPASDAITALKAALAEPQEPVVKEIASALNAMRAYALDNPCHYYKGVMQDPNGVHAWLARNEKPVSEYERGFIDGMQKQARRSVDKAVNAMAEPIIKPEIKEDKPFGYFRAEPFGWTDCAPTDEGAIPLYERPQAQQFLYSAWADEQIQKEKK